MKLQSQSTVAVTDVSERASRVLVATTYNDRTDIAIYRGLAQAGFKIDLMCSPGAVGCEALESEGIRVIQNTARNRVDLAALFLIRRMLRAEAYDLIYAPRNSTLSVCLWASIGMSATIIGFRGTVGHIHRYDPACWLAYLNPRITRIICISEAIRRYLMSVGIPEKRLVTIYLGSDPAWFTTQTVPELSAFGIPPNAFVVGFIGNMRPVKGIDVLIRAAHFLPKNLTIHFLMIGEVRDPNITRLANDERVRDRLHFAGFRNDAPALAAKCNAFVMPSVEREGLCRALMEAMAYGLPPVISNVGGMPELVLDKECGLVVPPRNAEALARAIETLARCPELCRQYGERARQRVNTVFHIQNTVDQTITLFKELAVTSRNCQPTGQEDSFSFDRH